MDLIMGFKDYEKYNYGVMAIEYGWERRRGNQIKDLKWFSLIIRV